MRFYLGAHQPAWLGHVGVPLFVSHSRLAGRKTLPRAAAPWALDSGGFTELSLHGGWRSSASEYAAAVRRYRDEIGQLDWAAPQDWMCEPQVIAKTGLSVAAHQRLTIANLIELRELAPDLPIVPVLQGWTHGDYLRHVEAYAAAGIDLASEPLVGLGTVCRRQATVSIGVLVTTLSDALPGVRLHGFGVKAQGLGMVAAQLASADSLAWSARGRNEPGCEPGHATEANCLSFALSWRAELLSR